MSFYLCFIDTNPYSFRPNPQQLAQEKEQEEEEKSGLYRAPRIAPVHYDEETKSDKRKKQQQRLLEKAAKSRLIQDLITEYDDRPEQQDVEGGVRDGYGGEDLLGARERERIRYEEENFTRLTLSKKEARRMRDGGLNRFTDEFKNLNDFSNLAGIQATEQEKRHEYSLLARRERRQHEREQNANRKRKGGVDGIMSDDDEDGSELGAFQRARRREVRRKMRKRQRK
jgi:U3 small nucleolar ribonucleoprotein protein LCP5